MHANLRLARSTARHSSGVTAPDRIRVVLAEDHATMRRSLRLLLDGEPNVEVVGEASDMSSAIGHVHGQHPAVLVLDFRMPNGSGLHTIRRLREDAPDTNIVVLTMERSRSLAGLVRDAGALGFVLKDTADVELPEAVRLAADGQPYISPRVDPSRQ
jgi:two-component system, NarL family, response regulator NreC